MSVVSNFPDEGDVDYKYGGDGKRRERDEEDGTDITWYNWDGYTVINEEADGVGLGDGALTRTYVGNLADITGSNPATGTARYYTHDHLGSTRGVYDASKNSLGSFEYTPYGSPYHDDGPADVTHRFTGHELDPVTGNYYAPYRYLNPSGARWMKQDPLGMISVTNMYGYVGGNPINFWDPLGLHDNPFRWGYPIARLAWESVNHPHEPPNDDDDGDACDSGSVGEPDGGGGEVDIPSQGDNAAGAAGDAGEAILGDALNPRRAPPGGWGRVGGGLGAIAGGIDPAVPRYGADMTHNTHHINNGAVGDGATDPEGYGIPPSAGFPWRNPPR